MDVHELAAGPAWEKKKKKELEIRTNWCVTSCDTPDKMIASDLDITNS